ncbi:hypothetical protein FH972_026312 [Carpinus fangiana]|uniref:Uncharacterized protein n=1 Tax=Carpinus fangiana TaxID=176857 RepID=A0A5N6L3L7_9ROSI|nr:hypothetical protein FH972_026312 [Carpinus fangiana]
MTKTSRGKDGQNQARRAWPGLGCRGCWRVCTLQGAGQNWAQARRGTGHHSQARLRDPRTKRPNDGKQGSSRGLEARPEASGRKSCVSTFAETPAKAGGGRQPEHAPRSESDGSQQRRLLSGECTAGSTHDAVGQVHWQAIQVSRGICSVSTSALAGSFAPSPFWHGAGSLCILPHRFKVGCGGG